MWWPTSTGCRSPSSSSSTPFTPFNHYSPWNVDDDGTPIPVEDGLELENLIDGVFNAERFLQLQRNFTAFDGGAEGYVKRIAKPHQYFAFTKAVGSTVTAVESNGKAGVVWRTQGSGKSMETELYAHLVSIQPKLKNPKRAGQQILLPGAGTDPRPPGMRARWRGFSLLCSRAQTGCVSGWT